MKRVILFAILFFAAALAIGGPAYAALPVNELTAGVGQKAGFNTKVDEFALSRKVGNIIKGALGFAGIVFLALTIYAGILWMTASGNDEQVSKSKSILFTSIIGIIIVMASYGITYFVLLGIARSNPADREGPLQPINDYGSSALEGGEPSASLGDLIDRVTD